MFPTHRPRRLRTTPAMRRLVAETDLRPRQLVLPMFVREGIDEPVPVGSMPGVVQHTRETLRKAATEAVAAGVGGLILFGVPAERDATGSAGIDPDGILNAALRDVRAEVGDAIVVMADLCLDEFTDHGHCGVLDARGEVDNDATLALYAEMAVAQAEAGAHMVGPSGMMDGQVGVIRQALDGAGHQDVGVIGYTVKYASAFFGPFREAVDSQLRGDRKAYQQDPPNVREALRELALDLEEGADIVMVKPAGSYLDVLPAVAETRLGVARLADRVCEATRQAALEGAGSALSILAADQSPALLDAIRDLANRALARTAIMQSEFDRFRAVTRRGVSELTARQEEPARNSASFIDLARHRARCQFNTPTMSCRVSEICLRT